MARNLTQRLEETDRMVRELLLRQLIDDGWKYLRRGNNPHRVLGNLDLMGNMTRKRFVRKRDW